MKTFVFILLTAIAIKAAPIPLTPDQLRQEADQICYGEITSIDRQFYCPTRACLDYTIDSVAHMNVLSC